MASPDQDASLPPYFPLVRKECEQVSKEFFQCLLEKTNPQGVTLVANDALRGCTLAGTLYSKCTQESLSARGAKKPIVLTEWEK